MKKVLAVLGLLLVIAAIGYVVSCPCDRLPGAWLSGDEPAGPVTDWSFVNDREQVPLCQIEVTTWRPHSLNLNCMAADGELFISCSNCAGKHWSESALTHSAGKIKAVDTLYPVNFRRVEEASLLDKVWAARLTKIGREQSPRPDHWWTFQLTSR